MNLENQKIAFIGCGNMARSLVSGLLTNHIPPKNIWVTGRNPKKLSVFSDKLKTRTTINNNEPLEQADIVVLCVKPFQLKNVCEEIATKLQEKKPLIISVAAGVTTNLLEKWIGGKPAIVRAMPNTPSAIGAGSSGLYANAVVTEKQTLLTESLMRSVGITCWLQKESELNFVTALAGSGPAYVYLLMEALQIAAIESGLPDDVAKLMTKQVVFGAAKMALESSDDVVQLRENVTSPGGTTESAIEVFEKSDFRGLISRAYQAAAQKAFDISQKMKA